MCDLKYSNHTPHLWRFNVLTDDLRNSAFFGDLEMDLELRSDIFVLQWQSDLS